MGGQRRRVDRVGEDEHRRLGCGLADDRDRGAGERRVLGDEREFVVRLRAELDDRLGAQTARERVEALGPARRFLRLWNPGEDLVLAGADLAPETCGAEPVTNDEPARHPPPKPQIALAV
jgi:hypothetical protein